MKRLLLLALLRCFADAAESRPCHAVGAIGSFQADAHSVTLESADHSETKIVVLAPDLIRVRAALGHRLAARDHSWAIANTAWPTPEWSHTETMDAIRIRTAELEVMVQRSPLLITFVDRATGQTINRDYRPMSYDRTGRVIAEKALGLDEHFYGLGEKAARLDHRRGVFAMWNSDTPAYVEGTDPLYQSIPFYIGWENGKAYGLFFDNSYRTHFDFGSTKQECIEFSADGGEMNYYFFHGPSMKKILGRYADLTGHMPLPPEWALGNQQSRYSYYPDSVAEEIVTEYRRRDLPLDVLHLDIHYMNGFRDFTWDPARFPDPDGFTARLRAQGVKVVTIVDPGVKYQPPAAGATDRANEPERAPQADSYYVYNEGKKADFFLHRKDGQLYIGRVWPGDAVFVDYTKPAALTWWGNLHRGLVDHGVAGIWNDMNEPADFVDKTGKSQSDVIFYDGGDNSPYAKNRNVFGLGMARGTYEGLLRRRPDARPFIITRAGYAGIQRYATMWTGDNTCTWDSLRLSIPMFESLGLSGEPFVGADIPGYRGTADGELLARWYEVGFLTPLCRNHAENRSYDHEPWRFGAYYEGIVRRYLKLRYRLMPYLYTTLEEAHRTGLPFFRPLLLNYQDDTNLLAVDDEFMVGADLLAAPVLAAGQTQRLVYLPPGEWFDFWTGAAIQGGQAIAVEAPLDRIPLFVRGGAVLPRGPEMNFVGEKPLDPLRLDIYPDAHGAAASTVYEDDGATLGYEKGAFRRTAVRYGRDGATAAITVDTRGELATPARTLEFRVHGAAAPQRVRVDGRDLARSADVQSGEGWVVQDGVTIVRIVVAAKATQLEVRVE